MPNGLATINSWWWNIGGTVVLTQSPGSVTSPAPGAVPVQLVVGTAEGCRSDTNKVTVSVRYQPQASFIFGPLLCDNEVISFTDKSTLPASATGEAIVKWYWTFDATNTSVQQNQALTFLAGVHKAGLVAETNYGCKSRTADTVLPFTRNRSSCWRKRIPV